jgi:hypothetical protein
MRRPHCGAAHRCARSLRRVPPMQARGAAAAAARPSAPVDALPPLRYLLAIAPFGAGNELASSTFRLTEENSTARRCAHSFGVTRLRISCGQAVRHRRRCSTRCRPCKVRPAEDRWLRLHQPGRHLRHRQLRRPRAGPRRHRPQAGPRLHQDPNLPPRPRDTPSRPEVRRTRPCSTELQFHTALRLGGRLRHPPPRYRLLQLALPQRHHHRLHQALRQRHHHRLHRAPRQRCRRQRHLCSPRRPGIRRFHPSRSRPLLRPPVLRSHCRQCRRSRQNRPCLRSHCRRWRESHQQRGNQPRCHRTMIRRLRRSRRRVAKKPPTPIPLRTLHTSSCRSLRRGLAVSGAMRARL